MGFTYFVKTDKWSVKQEEGPALKRLRQAGITFLGSEPVCRGTRVGFEDAAGILIRGPGGPLLPSYRPDEQTWRAFPWDDTLAIGFDNHKRPGPKSLARETMLAGRDLKLGDGNLWHIPIARSWLDEEGQARFYAKLPTQTDVDAEGNWVPGGIVPEHRELWDHAMNFMDAVWAETAKSEDDNTDGQAETTAVVFDYASQNDACLCALAKNYYVSKMEVAVLGLLNDTVSSQILSVLADVEALNEILKKKADELLNITDGEHTSTEDTDLVSPTVGQ